MNTFDTQALFAVSSRIRKLNRYKVEITEIIRMPHLVHVWKLLKELLFGWLFDLTSWFYNHSDVIYDKMQNLFILNHTREQCTTPARGIIQFGPQTQWPQQPSRGVTAPPSEHTLLGLEMFEESYGSLLKIISEDVTSIISLQTKSQLERSNSFWGLVPDIWCMRPEHSFCMVRFMSVSREN